MNRAAHFCEVLTKHYEQLFTTTDYAYAAQRTSPDALASKMTQGLLNGSANKDGDGIKRACQELGIKHTYKAITEYLKGAA